ncbi:hypothetical protein [Mucilaginibacter psychrotolerans]|uniref:Uncharacterized protein n=1 Tax=Mucilaginibacter psychrotolerans TaxID=1524096 RepID=A0A4Y8SMZ6_9SPHI|nr:hypothetical protein [Mucilaginibacter psychrotolerans]TFF40070.1 hypothetical protein E2R66_02115 [Mucilaginibacter psychrotolerans]
MTLSELYVKLKELGISEDRYYLHGLYGAIDDNDRLGLVMQKGKYSPEYIVYYKERGEMQSKKIFFTEDDACQYVYKSLVGSKTGRGQYPKE